MKCSYQNRVSWTDFIRKRTADKFTTHQRTLFKILLCHYIGNKLDIEFQTAYIGSRQWSFNLHFAFNQRELKMLFFTHCLVD